MILTLALLLILIQTPVWFLLIFAPESKPTQQVTGNYAIFVLIGIVYIFFAVAVLTYALSLNNSVSAALAAIPADTTKIDPEILKPITEALKLSANVQPTLLGALLGTAVLDLAGGLLAFCEMRTLGTARRTRSVLLLVMYVLGPVGMLVFGAWHYLNKARPQ
jgi:hypothetical protein